MPAPTVTAVNPTSGLSGAGNLVTITGTDFDTALNANVTVKFGTILATSVEVRSATKVVCLAPQAAIPIGSVSVTVGVTVENVDAGPNQGTGTLASAYTYSRPDFTEETHLTAVVRRLIELLQEQYLENTSSTTHSDYDLETSDQLNRIEAAKLPACVVVGPGLIPFTVCNFNDRVLKTIPAGSSTPTSYERYDQLRAVSLDFDVRLLSDSKIELLNMVQQAIGFMQRNEMIQVPRDPLNPGAGLVEYPLLIVGDFRVNDQPSRANVREAVASWRVEGVLLEPGDLKEAAPTVDQTPVQTEQIP